jgi:hypothetical protein
MARALMQAPQSMPDPRLELRPAVKRDVSKIYATMMTLTAELAKRSSDLNEHRLNVL